MEIAVQENEVTRALGIADAFALLCAGFTFPDERLAQAFCDGSFVTDMEAISGDAGLPIGDSSPLCESVARACQGKTPEKLLEAMKTEYSALYYAPGKFRRIYPYESVFKKRAKTPDTRAAAFLTRSTHDVERAMDGHGVLPEDARREPADFFVTELDFMRHLFTGYASALVNGEDAQLWRDDASRFYSNHVVDWVPVLFEKTVELSELDLYRDLARFGLLVLGCTTDYLG